MVPPLDAVRVARSARVTVVAGFTASESVVVKAPVKVPAKVATPANVTDGPEAVREAPLIIVVALDTVSEEEPVTTTVEAELYLRLVILTAFVPHAMVAEPVTGATMFTARLDAEVAVTTEPVFSAKVPAPVYVAVLVTAAEPSNDTCAFAEMVKAPATVTARDALTRSTLEAPVIVPVNVRLVALEARALLYTNEPLTMADENVTAGLLPVIATVPRRVTVPCVNDSPGPEVERVAPFTIVSPRVLATVPLAPAKSRVPAPEKARLRIVTMIAERKETVAVPDEGANTFTLRALTELTLSCVDDESDS